MERPKSNKNKWMERSESISLFRHRWVNLSTRFEIYLAVRDVHYVDATSYDWRIKSLNFNILDGEIFGFLTFSQN